MFNESQALYEARKQFEDAQFQARRDVASAAADQMENEVANLAAEIVKSLTEKEFEGENAEIFVRFALNDFARTVTQLNDVVNRVK